MKIIKKLLAFTLSASMVLGASGLDAFAKTEEDVSKTETNTRIHRDSYFTHIVYAGKVRGTFPVCGGGGGPETY